LAQTSKLRREELYVLGYYYHEDKAIATPPRDDQCVAWLAQLLDRPYVGKQDCINKLSFALSDDTLSGFMKFYMALSAGLNACGFSPHLLPILPLIHPDANLIDTPIIELSLLVIGTGDPTNLRQQQSNTGRESMIVSNKRLRTRYVFVSIEASKSKAKIMKNLMLIQFSPHPSRSSSLWLVVSYGFYSILIHIMLCRALQTMATYMVTICGYRSTICGLFTSKTASLNGEGCYTAQDT
jgi:hypothetical protein